MFEKGFSTILIIVIVLVVVAGGILAWQYWSEPVGPEPTTEDQEEIDQPVVENGANDEFNKEPYIKTITPNGGEEWTIGKIAIVKWDSVGVEKVNILLIDYRAPEQCVLNQEPVSASIGEYVFKVENYKCDGGMTSGVGTTLPIKNGEMYKIKIEDANQPDIVSDFSDSYFSILETNETANWQIYRNEEYGYKVKYPEECSNVKDGTMTVAEKQERIPYGTLMFGQEMELSRISFGSQILPYFSVTVYDNSVGESLEEFASQVILSKGMPYEASDIRWTLLTIGGYEAIKATYQNKLGGYDGLVSPVFIKKENYIYSVFLVTSGLQGNYDTLNDRILSTLTIDK